MARRPPRYIPVEDLQTSSPTHAWNDDDPYHVLPRIDEELREQMLGVTDLAKAAFVIANAEWVVYRFLGMLDNQLPLDYIEASWAKIINPALSKTWEPENWDDWLGPVRGPVATALLTITNVFSSVEETSGGDTEAAFASSIVRHVLKDTSSFLHWQEAAIARLQRAYQYVKDDPTGPGVPREAFDPEFKLTPDSAHRAIEDFLGSLEPHYGVNRFLIRPSAQDDRPQ